MGIVLDLSVFREETADVRMADGSVLHLKKPTQRMVIHMLEMKDVDADSPALEILGTLDRVTGEILNNNADGVSFDAKTVSALPTDMKVSVLQAYSDWAVQLQSNPISARPRGRTAGEERPTRSWLSRRMPWRNTRERR